MITTASFGWLSKENYRVIPVGLFIYYRLDKGVIVYICDSRGVRDIYDTDGSNAMAASEPLAVLVGIFIF